MSFSVGLVEGKFGICTDQTRSQETTSRKIRNQISVILQILGDFDYPHYFCGRRCAQRMCSRAPPHSRGVVTQASPVSVIGALKTPIASHATEPKAPRYASGHAPHPISFAPEQYSRRRIPVSLGGVGSTSPRNSDDAFQRMFLSQQRADGRMVCLGACPSL